MTDWQDVLMSHDGEISCNMSGSKFASNISSITNFLTELLKPVRSPIPSKNATLAPLIHEAAAAKHFLISSLIGQYDYNIKS